MDKLLEVTEYDTIICNPAFKSDEKYRYLDKEQFDNLVQFIHEFSGDTDAADILDFMRIGYKRNVGDTITIKNYVGLIQMKNGFQIQILPKIAFADGDVKEHTKTKKVFLHMLRSMRDFPSKVFTTASLQVDKMNLYELFINMYLQEVRTLVKRGLQSTYVNTEDNLNFFKGKLQIPQHIRYNSAHKERFYVAYDVYSQNRAENRLIKATLLKLQKLSSSAENTKLIRQLLTAFESVDASVNYEKDFAKVIIDRSTKAYETIMQWSKVFLLNKSFTTFSGSTTSRALLFPMESVYESYVAQQIKKVMIPNGWEVSTQDKQYSLFTTHDEKKLFALRPDIVMSKDGKTIVLDTKWKQLSDNERINYGISQTDMYQMYAYSKKYNAKDVYLLYPVTEEMRKYKDENEIYFHSNDKNSTVETIVHIFFVDIANIEESMLALNELLSK